MRLAAAIGVAAVLACSDGAAQIDVDDPRVKVDPSDPASPAYLETIEERNRKAREEAERRGKTHIDTTYGPFGDLPPKPELPALPGTAEQDAEKPAVAAREAARREERAEPAPAGPAAGRPERAAGDYGRSDEVGQGELRQLMGELLQALDREPEVVRLRAAERPPRRAEERRPEAARLVAAAEAGFPRVAVGSGLYGRVLYAVNSDFAGPVMIEVLEPPLVGAVLSGGFERVRDRLVLRMRRLSWRGREAQVEAWGVGLDCACYGVGGEVDRHWWERLILPAAVRFAQGWLTARGSGGRRVEVSGETVVEERARPTDREAVYTGLASAAGSVGELLLEDAPAGPTVRIPRNTEIAVVFARPPGERAPDSRSAAPAPRGPTAEGVIRAVARPESAPEATPDAEARGDGAAAPRRRR